MSQNGRRGHIGFLVVLVGLVCLNLGQGCPSSTGESNTGNQGPAGPAGPQGPKGDAGDTGAQGPAGQTGATGAAGAPGQACWDLNGNGVGDLPAEDINADGTVDVNGCSGNLHIYGSGSAGPLTVADGANLNWFAMPPANNNTSFTNVTIGVGATFTVPMIS